MKTAISIPDQLFKEAEAAAKDLGLSCSKLIWTALEEFLRRRRDAAVTQSINRYIEKYGADLSEEDEAVLATAAKCGVRLSGTIENRKSMRLACHPGACHRDPSCRMLRHLWMAGSRAQGPG